MGVLLKEAGAHVLYGDSPAAGTTFSGMRAAGYDRVADELGLELADFDKALMLTYMGMADDTRMIRMKRDERRRKMMGEMHKS